MEQFRRLCEVLLTNVSFSAWKPCLQHSSREEVVGDLDGIIIGSPRIERVVGFWILLHEVEVVEGLQTAEEMVLMSGERVFECVIWLSECLLGICNWLFWSAFSFETDGLCFGGISKQGSSIFKLFNPHRVRVRTKIGLDIAVER